MMLDQICFKIVNLGIKEVYIEEVSCVACRSAADEVADYFPR